MSNSTLTVLIPSLNAAGLLEGHLASMDAWIDLADEILVVDSFSTDGTFERLQDALAGRPARFFRHPRGLYESWNYGIQQATGHWLYISTIGDPITRDLLLHLRKVALAGELDVVLGNPQFVDEANGPLPHIRWAVTEIAQSFAQESPCTLSPEAALFLGVRYLHKSALLGSSSSNLYRTAHMQAHPFPTNHGPSGDAAWSMLYAFDTRFACTSMPGSFFRFHTKHVPAPDDHSRLLNGVLQAALDTCAAIQPASEKLRALRIPELSAVLVECARSNEALKQLRKSCARPWYFYPSIWSARRKRRRASMRLEALIHEGMELIRESEVEPVRVDKIEQDVISPLVRQAAPQLGE